MTVGDEMVMSGRLTWALAALSGSVVVRQPLGRSGKATAPQLGFSAAPVRASFVGLPPVDATTKIPTTAGGPRRLV